VEGNDGFGGHLVCHGAERGRARERSESRVSEPEVSRLWGGGRGSRGKAVLHSVLVIRHISKKSEFHFLIFVWSIWLMVEILVDGRNLFCSRVLLFLFFRVYSETR
jgi:hypothetical protein